MKKRLSIKAEDLLQEDNFSESSLQEYSKKNENDHNLKITAQIYAFLTSDQSIFSQSEKENLKVKIKISVRNLNWKKKFLRLSAAAAILVFCILSGLWYFQSNSSSDIVNFAQTLKNSIPDKEIKLILQNGWDRPVDRQLQRRQSHRAGSAP